MSKDVVMKAESTELSFIKEDQPTGFENMASEEVTMPLLLISQQLSDVVQSGKIKVGKFYNSVNMREYGSEVRMVVVKFEKLWYEWKPDAGGLVGIHRPYSIEVTGDNYTGMKHGENDVVETWVYLVVLPDFPEDGYLMFTSTKGNLRYLKNWNTQMRYLKFGNNKQAPIYGGIWKATLGEDANKQGKRYYSCSVAGKSSFVFDGYITKAIYNDFVSPALAMGITSITESEPAMPDKEETKY